MSSSTFNFFLMTPMKATFKTAGSTHPAFFLILATFLLDIVTVNASYLNPVKSFRFESSSLQRLRSTGGAKSCSFEHQSKMHMQRGFLLQQMHQWQPHTQSKTTRKRRAFALSSESSSEEKNLTPEAIAEMIEVSFLQSCLQLSQGYVDVLKLFIAAVKAGYENEMPLESLITLVDNCPVNSAGRDLMAEEKDLRNEWMTVVFKMMEALGGTDSKLDCGEGSVSNERVDQVVKAVLSIKEELEEEDKISGGKTDATVSLNNLNVEEAFRKSSSLSELNESTQNPMEKAFLTNDVRVALLTCRVVDEEMVCKEDSSGRSSIKGPGMKGEIPRPPIPGT